MKHAVRFIAAASLLFAPLLAADDNPLPAGGVPVFGPDDSVFKVRGNPALVAPVETVSANGPGFDHALRLRTLAPSDTPYEVQLAAPTTVPIHAGDVMFARFYLRRTITKGATGDGQTEFTIEQGGPDYRKLVLFGGRAGTEWKEFSMPFVATPGNIGGDAIAAGKATILFRLGYGPQTIELGGIQLLNFGNKVRVGDLPRSKITYEGREESAMWRVAAEQRIERIRKGDMEVQVKDAAGNAVEGATVAVEMRQHAFGFGSAVAANMLLGNTPDAEKYREVVLKYFNKVVLENDLKWPNWEAHRKTSIAAVQWLVDHDIQVRGHNLVWPSWHFLPKDLQSLKDNPAALRKRVDDHITDEVSALKGRCVEWDVVNELYANHNLTDVLGKDALLEWYRLAHQADPGARLYINDYDTIESGRADNPHTYAYQEAILYLLAHGAPLSGAGIQSHFGWSLPSPTSVLNGLDRFGALGIDLEITEYDVDVTDEQLQADYTRDYMTLAFSHPSVTGFLSWGFWEGQHWKPEAAYFRKDWSIKPAGQAWIDLVTKKWWTKASGQTDAQGSYKTRGFFGEYVVTVSKGDKTKTMGYRLKRQGEPLVITLD